MSAVASRVAAVWLVVAATGCGGAASSPATATPPEVATARAREQTIALGVMEVRGIAFGPEALGPPPMPRAAARGKATLDQLRRKVARANPAADDVRAMVSLLWGEAEALGDATATQAVRDEARASLRDLRAREGAAPGEMTLDMLAAAEEWLGDDAAAIAVYQELLARAPPPASARTYQARLARVLLRQHRVDEAAALMTDWTVAELDDRAAYLLAWARFAAGDATAARAAIVHAMRAWSPASGSEALIERDLVMILARTGTEVAEATRLVAEVSRGSVRQRYLLTFRLAEAYRYGGRYQEASDALDVVMNEVVPGKMPADDQVAFRFRQADDAFRLERLDVAAERALDAHRALDACGEKCAGPTAEAVTARILQLARFSHKVFATAQDGRHRDAAAALYQYYLALPGRPDAEAVRAEQRSLDQAAKTADPRASRRDPLGTQTLTAVRREAAAACYEAALVRDPSLAGSIDITLDVDAAGAVTGATSSPSAGAGGMAAVAGCTLERMRSWRFPALAAPGVTHVTMLLSFRRQEQ
jgi:tetratricopeptide (TPR) repeat protein